ncbi:hypothetical protein [Janthinobacterium lividum]|uniref:hypothetical protein n=1 Tax=Janthinobacterium lividum TaxID=29581 RepID=UPI0015878FDE|nr:hypothetical protein [Janthinobacterium lividum]MCC7716733.1 hypothetical protein [Janthinobacterium lividum]WQE31801.1 hypothetical protein U0004_29765 [Janthinobacterium lividum]
MIQHQTCCLLFEFRGKRTSLLAHQTPLCGEHSRLNQCPGTLNHYKDVIATPVTRMIESDVGVRYLREFNAGRAIGFDKFNDGQATSVMTVMTDRFGNLVTAFPGVLK